jgi:hypothetical protein
VGLDAQVCIDCISRQLHAGALLSGSKAIQDQAIQTLNQQLRTSERELHMVAARASDAVTKLEHVKQEHANELSKVHEACEPRGALRSNICQCLCCCTALPFLSMQISSLDNVVL